MAIKRREKKGFQGIELNEDIVQAIFNLCLAKQDSKEITSTTIFPTTRGYKREDDVLIYFDSMALIKHKHEILYLFGQLQAVHLPASPSRVSIDDYNTTYCGEHWTSNKGIILKFCYLGSAPQVLCTSPFRADTNTSVISKQVKPTLSPKDPDFPAWWEAHKAEWEQ